MPLVTLLVGCDSDSQYSDIPPDACKKQHMNGEMAVCEELYAEKPYVHLPKDTDFEVFAGVEEGAHFVTRSGASYGGVDTDAEILRHGTDLYQVLVDGHEVKEYRPAIQFDEKVFFNEIYGRSAEGTVSRRMGETWEEDPTLPVRVEFQTAPADEPLVTIVNFEEAITASDGACLPAITSYGDESTFPAGSALELNAGRVPSMHDFGDQHFIVTWTVDGEYEGTLMNHAWYRGPIDIARGTLEVSDTYEGMGHGSPGAIPNLFIDLVDGGGDPCTP